MKTMHEPLATHDVASRFVPTDLVHVKQTAAKLAAGLFAIAAALIPRRRDVVGLAAMAAAVLIALQLGITHWFYLYAAWFLPFIFVVLFGRWSEGERDPVATP